jgi:hypothetical protein
MSDNHRVYRTIKEAIMQLCPGEPKGNTARMNKRLFHWRRGLATVIIVLVMLGLTTTLAFGANPNPKVFPPNSRPYGLTYGQWSAAWWQWAIAIPMDNSPLFDPTGENCDEGQSGPVWYLAGSFGGDATRDCNIPLGKAILFPVINGECSTIEGNGTTEEELRACAKTQADTMNVVQASIDGVDIENLDPPDSPYRVQSPLFTFALPPDDVLGLNTGDSVVTSPSVADGYWIMLKPLSPGEHTLTFHGEAGEFTLSITYHLKVGK